jgi:hypothetical protein
MVQINAAFAQPGEETRVGSRAGELREARHFRVLSCEGL